MTVEALVRRRTALVFMWLSLLVLGIVVLSSCALPDKWRAVHVVDQDRTFQYGALQLDPSSGLMVLERASLETNGQDHGLLIEGDLADDRKVCVEVARVTGHEHKCVTLLQLRTWIRADAPAPRAR